MKKGLTAHDEYYRNYITILIVGYTRRTSGRVITGLTRIHNCFLRINLLRTLVFDFQEKIMKQMMGICLLVGLFLISGLLYGGSVATLEEVLNPSGMYVDDNQLYVTDGVNVFIYSLKDYKLVKRFGKLGDGPAEFRISTTGGFPLLLDVQGDDLLVNSQNRLSFFSKKGVFIKERKIEGLLGSYYQRIGKGYIGMRSIFVKQTVYFGIFLFDDKFNTTKEIIRRKHYIQRNQKFNPIGGPMSFALDSANNQIAIYPNDGSGSFYVFNHKGEKKTVITPALDRIKLTAEHKKRTLHFYQTDIRIKKYWRFMKPLMEFPEHFPMVRGFATNDSKIYIVTSYQKNTSSRILTYDGNGKLIQDKYYPLVLKNFLEVSPFAVKNNKIYQLAENEDEEWELRITNIK